MGCFGTLVVIPPSGGETLYALDSPEVTIGRGAENDVVLLDIKVSRRHAVLSSSATGWKLTDLGSSNGFKFNGQRVRSAVLQVMDHVLIGATTLRVLPPKAAHEDATAMTQGGDGLDAALVDHRRPKLVVTREGGSHEYALKDGRTLIGRAEDAAVVVDHPRVSRHHVEITTVAGRVKARDLGSRNGTLLNGAALNGPLRLRNGDTLDVGDARIVFKAGFTQDELSVVTVDPQAAVAAPADTKTSEGVSHASISKVREVTQASAVSQRLPRGSGAGAGSAPRKKARLPGRLPVVVVPGFMGSQLFRGDALVWPAPKTFMKSPEILKLPEQSDLTPRGLVEEVVVIPGLIKLDAYKRLVDYLVGSLGYTEGKDLFVFGYDWRLDLRHAARSLGNAVSEWEELPGRAAGKFILIAHSAGGLVSRYYVERMGGRHHVERLILLGTPNRGTPKPLMSMLGAGGLLPFGASKQRLKETVGTFLSAYQLLPSYPVVYDEKGPVMLLDDDSWVPERARLAIKDAREFHAELSTPSRVPAVSIFGYGQRTLARIEVRRSANGEFVEPKFIEEECGDGTVSQESAVLPGSEIHPVQQQHGALYTDNDVKMRLKMELLGKF
jgi:pSer/pThr/pTyr-binding forkhead associated (FHA) protein/pimeloyl-ACP methyl ester carboxylesterase